MGSCRGGKGLRRGLRFSCEPGRSGCSAQSRTRRGQGRKSCRSLCPPGPPYAFADMDNSPCFSLVTGESLELSSRAMAQSTILQRLERKRSCGRQKTEQGLLSPITGASPSKKTLASGLAREREHQEFLHSRKQLRASSANGLRGSGSGIVFPCRAAMTMRDGSA